MEASALMSVIKFSTGSELRGAAVAARTNMCTKGVASASSHATCTEDTETALHSSSETGPALQKSLHQ